MEPGGLECTAHGYDDGALYCSAHGRQLSTSLLGGGQAQTRSSTSIALPWILRELGKQHLLNKVTLLWESNPGPFPIQGIMLIEVVFVGLKKLNQKKL